MRQKTDLDVKRTNNYGVGVFKKILAFPGVRVGITSHKLMLYADDILLKVSDLVRSILVLLHTLYSFSKLSGYKLNSSKSEALPLTSYCPQSLFQAGTFQWPREDIRYLGMLFPHQLSEIAEKNLTHY